ncbi:MAG: Ig-like domain-containing protein [Deltaproteobacteria bacterium]|nr:Ig-like domain-containing protein [Deltaproteobacteria bacterium]
MSQYKLVILGLLVYLTNCVGEYLPTSKEELAPLYVVSTIPKNGAINVDRSLVPFDAVVINFSKPLDEKYINEEYFDFTCNSLKVDYKVLLSDDKKGVYLKLKRDYILPEGAYCRVVISKLIRDTTQLPLHLSERDLSLSLMGADTGLSDISEYSDRQVSYEDKRIGEGDYILEFMTIYDPLKIVSINPEDKTVIPTSLISEFPGVFIRFNKPLDPKTVNQSNFIVMGRTAKLSLRDNKYLVNVEIVEGLKEGETYYLTVMPFVMDESGIMLDRSYNFSFSTEFVQPKVELIDPPDGTLTVNYNLKAVSIEFNKDIDPSTINNYTIILSNVEKYDVRYENRIAYIENFRLKEKTKYTVYVSSQIKDTSGFALAQSYYSNFKTTFDTPYVKSIFPANKAKNVPSTLKAIDIEFSEAMNFARVDASMFRIKPTIRFFVKILNEKSLQLVLLEPLISGNTYQITVNGSYFSDESGIFMEKDYVSEFTVSSIPDNNIPSEVVLYSKPIADPVEDKRKGFVLEWKAPSSDVINGKPFGRVKGYSLVYSDRPFSQGEFENMIELANVPTPANPGDVQNMVLYSFIDKDNNEERLVYNKTYYFMLRATDGTNAVYSNLLPAGVFAERSRVYQGSKFFGVSMRYIQNFNNQSVLVVGDTDDTLDGKVVGSVTIGRLEDSEYKELVKIYGQSENSLFGYRVESVDLNSDGCSDLVVSAPLDGFLREGAVYVFPQTKSDSGCVFDAAFPVRLSGESRESMFGFSVSKFIMNKKEHLLVGAPNYGELNTGAVFIYMSRPNILEIPPKGDVVISGKVSGSSFGYSAISEDINNDGCPDFIISAPDGVARNRGSVYVLYTGTSVSGCVVQNTNIDGANIKIDGDNDYTRLGYNVLAIDVNGDNKLELIMSGRDERLKAGFILIRDGNTGNQIRIVGEHGGSFGSYIGPALDFRKDGCGGVGTNKTCKDIFISDTVLSRIYLLEGEENLLQKTATDLIVFYDDKRNTPSFGYSFLVFSDGKFENLIVSSPFIKSFYDYVSEVYIYK